MRANGFDMVGVGSSPVRRVQQPSGWCTAAPYAQERPTQWRGVACWALRALSSPFSQASPPPRCSPRRPRTSSATPSWGWPSTAMRSCSRTSRRSSWKRAVWTSSSSMRRSLRTRLSHRYFKHFFHTTRYFLGCIVKGNVNLSVSWLVSCGFMFEQKFNPNHFDSCFCNWSIIGWPITDLF